MPRRVLVVTHTGRAAALSAAQSVRQRLTDRGLTPVMLGGELDSVDASLPAGQRVPTERADPSDPARGAEMIIVIGGDGTILRAAELARGSGAPLLGVNLGHVGFLAESERADLDRTVDIVAERAYRVEERMAMDLAVTLDGRVLGTSWALNEAAIEKAAPARMLEVALEVDGRPLSTFGADGVLLSTPTGSTAYAFSAGGPIVWPEVEALLLVPLAPHALFARPLVVSPHSVMAVELLPGMGVPGVLWCDGRRRIDLPIGARVEATRSTVPVRLARLTQGPFTDRLVRKFDLPVTGWRGPGRGAE